MRRIRILGFALGLVMGSLSLAGASAEPVCHDDPGSCCEDVTLLGKTIIPIDC